MKNRGFLRTEFSVYLRPLFYINTVVLAIKPLFFIYFVGNSYCNSDINVLGCFAFNNVIYFIAFLERFLSTLFKYDSHPVTS